MRVRAIANDLKEKVVTVLEEAMAAGVPDWASILPNT